jgi:hypothetical protein
MFDVERSMFIFNKSETIPRCATTLALGGNPLRVGIARIEKFSNMLNFLE